MKKLAHFVLAAILMTSTATGMGTAFPTAAVAMEQPWARIIYFSGGQPVGTADLYCSGDVIYTGQTTNYDYEEWTYYSMCP